MTAADGHVDVLKLLLERGANIQTADNVSHIPTTNLSVSYLATMKSHGFTIVDISILLLLLLPVLSRLILLIPSISVWS